MGHAFGRPWPSFAGETPLDSGNVHHPGDYSFAFSSCVIRSSNNTNTHFGYEFRKINSWWNCGHIFYPLPAKQVFIKPGVADAVIDLPGDIHKLPCCFRMRLLVCEVTDLDRRNLLAKARVRHVVLDVRVGSDAVADGVVKFVNTAAGLSLQIDTDGHAGPAVARPLVTLSGVTAAQLVPSRDLVL